MDKVSAQLPKNLRQWVSVSLVIILALLIFIVSVAFAQHQADDQFIGQDELKRNIQELESYTSEAKFTTQYYQRHIASRAFVQAHGSELQEAADSVAEKLDEHPHAKNLEDKVSQAIDLANQLSGQLQELTTQPVSQLPAQSETDQFYRQLSDKLQNLEAGL